MVGRQYNGGMVLETCTLWHEIDHGDRFGSRVNEFGWGAKIIDDDDLVHYLWKVVVGYVLDILMLCVIKGDKDIIPGLC